MNNLFYAPTMVQKQIAAMLIATLTMWAIGFPLWMKADAAQLIRVSDTLSDSDKNVLANHTIEFTTTDNAIAEDDQIVITLDSEGQLFNVPAAMNFEDIDVKVGGADVAVAAVKSGASWGVTVDNVADTFTFTVGSGAVAASTTVQIEIGTNATFGSNGAEQITNPNPASAGGVGTSYRIDVGVSGTNTDAATTRVAIIDDVTMTAAVDTVLNFNIYGTATTTSINGVSTTGSSTSVTLPFGTLSAGPAGAKILGQRLTVETNAKNGFSVTVAQDQNLLSASAADIDLFVDGDATSTPQTWTSPSNNIADENTWGHYGITSQDSTLSWGGGDPFGSQLFAGNFASSTPLEIFYHNGPSDGTTDDIGETYVAVEIEIASLQEAANDYTNTLTYVATPVF
jgi:hypothetical protein